MKSLIRNAFSEYHLNKFNVSFEFKLISMVVSITTLLIQAKNHTKAVKSCRELTPVMSIEFMFPLDTAQWKGIDEVDEPFQYPNFLWPTWRHSLLREKYVMEKLPMVLSL